jgi:hypothetical protein
MATLSHRQPSSAGTFCGSHRAQGHGKRDTCKYELRFVGHDPVPMGNRIPIAGRLMGQAHNFAMLASDYPLTQRQLPDERNAPFHAHENPNDARTNITYSKNSHYSYIQLKGTSNAAAERNADKH